MKSLLDIDNFGAIDADNDELLLDCFEDHKAYKDLLDFKKYLIIGKKGSGKTAIFKKMLITKSHDYFCFGHTFSDYPWYHHDKQARLGIPDFDKYTHSWKYLILLTVSKIILNQDQSLPHDDISMENMIKIERFVVDTYGSRDPDITQIFTPTKRLHLKPNFQIDWKLLKAGVSPEMVPMEELPTIVQEVNDNLAQYVLSCLNPKHKYYLCFDQLDLGFDPNDQEYSNRLVGLLLACRDLNIRANEKGVHLFVSVFLRDDIYDVLHFEDKNKITENYVSAIEWDTGRTQKTLKGLMERRFNKLLANRPDEKITWEDVFDETKEMKGHQSKYRHILDRTYLRPRDIIRFCNTVLIQYKRRHKEEEQQTDNPKFDNYDINQSKMDYSDYFLKELDDEIHKHVPEYKKYFEVFRSLGVMQFNKDEFINTFDERKSLFPEIDDPLQILKDLFEFSVVGFYRAGGRGYGGSEYVFKYREPRAQFDETAQKFRLHWGLVDILGLKQFSWK